MTAGSLVLLLNNEEELEVIFLDFTGYFPTTCRFLFFPFLFQGYPLSTCSLTNFIFLIMQDL